MEVEDFFKIYKDAAWDKDAASMISLYDEQAVIFDTWNQGYIPGRAAWVNIIEDWFSGLGEEKVKVDFEMIKIQQSANTAFASALIQYQAISGEGVVLRSMKNRITIGFSKREDGWKVMHQHMSAPVSSDTLTAILKI